MAKLLSAHGIALIALNVALFGTFIGIFFFTFGSFIEKLVLKREIKLILDGFVGDFKTFVSDDTLTQLHQFDEKLADVDTSGDQAVLESNKFLLNKALVIFGIMLAIALGVVITAWYMTRGTNKSFSLQRLFGESFGLLLFVAVVEVLFYWLVVANYRTVDANFVKENIIKNAKAYAKTK